MLAVEEERNIVKGVELAEKTMIATTDKGTVATKTVEKPEHVAVDLPERGPPEPKAALPDIWDCCCACDHQYKWYELKGKGYCCILLLLLFRLVAGLILLPFAILLCVLCCCVLNEGKDSSNHVDFGPC